MDRLACLCFVAATLIDSATAQSQATVPATASISGFVISENNPLADAEVRVRNTSLIATSGPDGSFLINGAPIGELVIDVKRVGFVSQEFRITLSAGQNRRVNLTLPGIAQTLPGVTVKGALVKPLRHANTSRYDEYYERKAIGIGTFITREEIDKKFKARTQELLQTIPGVIVRQHGTEWWVQFPRCGSAKTPRSRTAGRASELVQVFIDGRYAPGGTDELDEINPAQIEAIEVYKGIAQLPAGARGRGCGAIYVWLRDGS